jgi:hypothetical protein
MRPGLLLVAFLASTTAHAEFLPGASRAISNSDSASRDAPVFEYAYGPRAQLSLGGELGLFLWHRPRHDFRISLIGLIALEDGSAAEPIPEELYRLHVGVLLTWARTVPVGMLEFSLGIVRDQAATLGRYELPEATPANGIPFGGGGTYLEPGVAWRAPLRSFELTLRLTERLHIPAFPLMFGQRVAGDVVADATSDALTNEPTFEAVLRWRPGERWQPLISGHADVQFPVDQEARTGFFVRGLLGVAIRGSAGEVIPFVSGDLGNGLGLLVNRVERRRSVGVRYAAF